MGRFISKRKEFYRDLIANYELFMGTTAASHRYLYLPLILHHPHAKSQDDEAIVRPIFGYAGTSAIYTECGIVGRSILFQRCE